MSDKTKPKRPTLTKGSELTLAVTDLNNLGAGVAHTKEGLTVFLPGAVAGDTVRTLIVKVNTSFAVGKVLEVLSPSPDRVEGFCDAAFGMPDGLMWAEGSLAL